MLFRIGASRNPIKEGTLAESVQGGVWASINANDKNEAVKIFFQKYVEDIFELRDFRIYQATDDTRIYLLDYCIEDKAFENITFEDPNIVF